MNGSAIGCEPAAMIAFRNLISLLPPPASHFEVMRVDELADALHDLDLAPLGHAGEAAGQLADDLVLVRAQPVEVDARRAEADAAVGHVLRFVHDAGDVQQRLGRDAADVEADAAERRVALDEDGLHAEVGAAESRRVTARAGAEDEHLALEVGAAGDRRPRPAARGRRWPLVAPAALVAGVGPAPRRRSRSGPPPFLPRSVAQADLHLLDDAGNAARHVHRRLVGFEGDQRVVDLDRVAGATQISITGTSW
jgi:hypothetical protein